MGNLANVFSFSRIIDEAIWLVISVFKEKGSFFNWHKPQITSSFYIYFASIQWNHSLQVLLGKTSKMAAPVNKKIEIHNFVQSI